MLTTAEFVFFIILSLYILKIAICYGIYEFKNNNKFGGSFVIVFSMLTVILFIVTLIIK